VASGIWAAARVPFQLRGRALDALMAAPEPAATPRPVPRGAVGAANRMVAALARVPGSPWRDTCLYRSIAECLVLRRYGVPAFVRIGVRNENPPHGRIMAHAWVVRAGDDGAPPEATHNELLHSLLVRG
jgi:hypothetical protein